MDLKSAAALIAPFTRGTRRNFLILVSGSMGAQLITFAINILLGRIYTPAQFGVLGSFQAAAVIVGAVNSLQFAQAIVLPKRHVDGYALMSLSLLVVVCVGLLVVGFQVVVPDAYERLTGIRPDAFHVAAFSFFCLVSGANVILVGWCVRKGKFTLNSLTTLLTSSLSAILQLVFGLIRPSAQTLILGFIVGAACSQLFLSINLRKDLRRAFRVASWSRYWRLVREYHDFPLYNMPQTLVNSLSQGLPVFMLLNGFGVATSGQYTFGRRLLNVPYTIVASALRQLMLKSMVDSHQKGRRLLPLFLKYTGTILAFGAVPAVLGFAFMPVLFVWLFGGQWRIAGDFSRWLLIWLIPALANIPAMVVSRIIRRQRYVLVYEIAMLFVRSAALYLGIRFCDPLTTVILFSVSGAAGNVALIIIFMLMLRRRSNGDDGTGGVMTIPEPQELTS